MIRAQPFEYQSQPFDPECRRCPRLNKHLQQLRGTHADYWNKPVPPLGDHHARILIVGLAPGLHGANRTGKPFCGDQSGDLLFSVLQQAGLKISTATSISPGGDEGSGIPEVRITNAVKCLPPANKPTAFELNNCGRFLAYELDQLCKAEPPVLVLCLGRVAHHSVLKCYHKTLSRYPFEHGSAYWLTKELMLIDSYHCSRYNIQTGRLNRSMFQKVVDKARTVVEKVQ